MKQLNYAEAVDRAMRFVNEAREKAFPEIPADTVKVVHDQIDNDPYEQGAHWIEFGDYVLTPVTKFPGLTNSLCGVIPVIGWNLYVNKITCGNRLDPPDVDEVDLGDFRNEVECLVEIGKINVRQQLEGIAQGIQYEEEAAEEKKMWAEMNPPEKI